MDRDIKYIIDEEQKLTQMLEDAGKAGRKRIEEYRSDAVLERDTAFENIASEYKRMTEENLQEIRSAMERQSQELRHEQERLIDDIELRKRITGRIVSVILEDR